MKTPDYILFVKEEGGGKYDPNTGGRTEPTRTEWGVPCLVVPMSFKKEYDEYGTRNRRLVTVHMNRRLDSDFTHAIITSKLQSLNAVKFSKVEDITPSRKTVIRLERMG